MVPPYCTTTDNFECYAEGTPACCHMENPAACTSLTAPPCDVSRSTTSSTYTPDPPSDLAMMTLPSLSLPPGGLHNCNEIIPSDYENGIIPKEVISAMIAPIFGEAAAAVVGLVQYDVRARKVCTTCQEMNELWEANNACSIDIDGEPCTSKAFATEVMPYCTEGSFAYGRTMSGLLLEPIDPTTKEPIVGKVAATIFNNPTSNDPFNVPSQWPSNIATTPNSFVVGIFPASAGTYTLLPDVLGLGEDWESVRSYMIKALYQASAVPLLLKAKDVIEKENKCTELDKRVNVMGFSEAGYATIAISHAIDMLDDDYMHTYTGVGGAPIQLSSVQLTEAVVKMYEGTFPLPQYLVRLGNAYSSTNGDVVNTDKGQDMITAEYLDPIDENKDVREWVKAGLSYEEMVPYIPKPPSGLFTDLLNPSFLNMIINSNDAGYIDPCNSEFKTDDVDALCEAIVDQDMNDTLSSFEYPVVICHSPEDEIIFYSNVPNTTLNNNLIMIEDLPFIGDIVKPSGGHRESGGQCTFGFILAFVAPPETSNIRSILPVDDPDGTCGGEAGGTGPTTTSSPTSPGSDIATAGTLATSSSVVDGGASGTNSTTNTAPTASGSDDVDGGEATGSPMASPTESDVSGSDDVDGGETAGSPTPSPTESDVVSAAHVLSTLTSVVAAMLIIAVSTIIL